MDDLDEAAAAYWLAAAEYDAAREAVADKRLQKIRMRTVLADAIVEAFMNGMPQAEITRRTRYKSRESVREILRDRGIRIEPDE